MKRQSSTRLASWVGISLVVLVVRDARIMCAINIVFPPTHVVELGLTSEFASKPATEQ